MFRCPICKKEFEKAAELTAHFLKSDRCRIRTYVLIGCIPGNRGLDAVKAMYCYDNES